MFQTEVNEGGGFASFLLQQVAVCIGSVALAGVTAPLPIWFSRLGASGSLPEAASIIIAAAVPMFLCGRWIRSKFPQAGLSGRWIWFLPSILLVFMLIGAFMDGGLDRDIAELFFPQSEGEAWAAVFLGTYPTLGCIGYSLDVKYQSTR